MNRHYPDPRTPVIVGVGQVVRHWSGDTPSDAPNPNALRHEAARIALDDTQAPAVMRDSVDLVMVVRTNADSLPGVPQPFGRCANPPATLARDLGIAGARHVYSVVGGDQPQSLVNEAAERLFAGECRAAVLCGAEAIGALKHARRKRIGLDWTDSVEGPLEDRGIGDPLLSDYERANGLGMPTQTYPLFEHALRQRLGHTREQYRALIGELWARFSEIAQAEPFAQFPAHRSAGFLATESAENYRVADPYLKWHVAQDAVNQGAALVMTTVGEADRAGIPRSHLVFLHGYAGIKDRFVTERADLSRSAAIDAALDIALKAAGKTGADIAHRDLYSCFPCAVLLAAEALGTDWRTADCTVTGGLPFFGGAGNNYAMHAIARMVERLRRAPDDFGLVLANGGFLSKESVGIYSARPPESWQPVDSRPGQQAVDAVPSPALIAATCEATVASYTVVYAKGAPVRGFVLAQAEGGRILARARPGHRATLAALAAQDPVGQRLTITHVDGVNYFEPSDRLGQPAPPGGLPARTFPNVLIRRDGHLLEVTLNRPEARNALYTAVHYELHEIWDNLEADRDLWVAVMTGAGDRAFCSGNDLKVTAAGGDMSLPASGFAGLCNRLDRRKPIIAAVNGAALGGGLEIILACDLAVADESADLALPEVKVGLFAAAGGVQRLTRQIGRKAAMDLILTGRTFDAREAEQLGLVNAVCPNGKAREAALAMAETVLAASPAAIQATREVLNLADQAEQLGTALAASGPVFRKLMKSKDFREGVSAFVEKRKPVWTGE
ncbi:enoyl-CoA hydratase-related protein [Novosphingobium bradum]|uniref:Enoyl-CoA hydratase-related protein n=1 Tax=Novosphingobium bradum TaxID=1737444 RepID=A0ABV7IR47_9SPHN